MRRTIGRFALLSFFFSLASVAGCSPAGTGASGPATVYAGHAAELFDDTIEARAVGLDPEAKDTTRTDTAFRERAQLSDACVRVLVTTITTKQEDSGMSYQLGFRVTDVLAGAHPPPTSFTVTVDRNGPSAGILRSYESALIGKRFIAFVRQFGRTDGEREYHFHLSPDTKEVLRAVQEATALGAQP